VNVSNHFRHVTDPFEAVQPGDLELEMGEEYEVIEKTASADGWWKGRSRDGQEGLVCVSILATRLIDANPYRFAFISFLVTTYNLSLECLAFFLNANEGKGMWNVYSGILSQEDDHDAHFDHLPDLP
jgi:hypothetical protein